MPLEIKYGAIPNIKRLLINKVDKDFQEIEIIDTLFESECKFLIHDDDAKQIIAYLQEQFSLNP